MAQNPPTGVVCSAGVVEACCCLVSLIKLPVTAIVTLKVALRSGAIDLLRIIRVFITSSTMSSQLVFNIQLSPKPQNHTQITTMRGAGRLGGVVFATVLLMSTAPTGDASRGLTLSQYDQVR